jgi:hypothetical protein
MLFFFFVGCASAKISIFDIPGLQGHVEVRNTWPTPREFFETYGKEWGKPVVFKGAASKMNARYT